MESRVIGTMLFLPFQTKDDKGNLHGMPSPVDGDPSTPWPHEFWLHYMRIFTAFGGTVGVTPPLTKGASLGTGYDPYNHFDLGSNPHGPAGRRETRYGSVEGLMGYVAQVNAMGAETYANIVHHHVDGDRGDWKYDYIAGDGKTPGRFPKDINCFWVWNPKTAPTNPDAVFNPQWDLGFGREFKWNSGTYGDGKGTNGPGYVRQGLADSLDWQTRRLGLEGYFLDDAKGTNPQYIGWLLNQRSMADKVSFVELSDGNTGTLNYWMQLVNERAGVLDFALRYKIRDVCNSSADMRCLLSEGVCWSNPLRAVTFSNNIDLDLSDPIYCRLLLANSFILGFPGYPAIFGKDIYPAPHGYGLLDPVMNLLWCKETFVKGDLFWRALAPDHLVWEMMGDHTSSGCICCASIRDNWHQVTVQTKWKNQQLHDYTGQAEDKWTDANGMLTFWMPPDRHGAGRGYVRYAVPNIQNNIQLIARRTTQTFFGADDLDIPSGRNGSLKLGTITAAKDSAITSRAFAYSDLSGAAILTFFVAPDGKPLQGYVPEDTEYEVHAVFEGFPPGGEAFEVEVSYQAPRLPFHHA